MESECLIKRVEKLERENRLFKIAAVAIAVAAIPLLLMGATKAPRTIEAEKIILRDSNGRARVTIGTPENSGVAVDMKPDAPVIWLSDNKGTDRTIITTDGLYFADSDGKKAVDLINSSEGSGLRFYDRRGIVSWSAP